MAQVSNSFQGLRGIFCGKSCSFLICSYADGLNIALLSCRGLCDLKDLPVVDEQRTSPPGSTECEVFSSAREVGLFEVAQTRRSPKYGSNQ